MIVSAAKQSDQSDRPHHPLEGQRWPGSVRELVFASKTARISPDPSIRGEVCDRFSKPPKDTPDISSVTNNSPHVSAYRTSFWFPR
jgi:hypothetical protein